MNKTSAKRIAKAKLTAVPSLPTFTASNWNSQFVRGTRVNDDVDNASTNALPPCECTVRADATDTVATPAIMHSRFRARGGPCDDGAESARCPPLRRRLALERPACADIRGQGCPTMSARDAPMRENCSGG